MPPAPQNPIRTVPHHVIDSGRTIAETDVLRVVDLVTWRLMLMRASRVRPRFSRVTDKSSVARD